MSAPVRTAVVPHDIVAVREAVSGANAVLAAHEEADSIVWTDWGDPDGLAKVLSHSPARWIQLISADIAPFVEARLIESDRTWTSAKRIYGPAVAEHALALTLVAAGHLRPQTKPLRFKQANGGRRHAHLFGTAALVVGTGGIGQAYARMVAPLGVRVLAVNRSGAPLPEATETYAVRELAAVVPRADWIVLAAPCTAETEHLFSDELFSAMRPKAWIINVATGRLIRTEALVTALENRSIGGAALDVTEPQPLPDGHALWRFPNVLITSGSANPRQSALREFAGLVKRNLSLFSRTDPLEGVIDLRLGY